MGRWDNKEWTRFTRIEGDRSGAHYFIKGEHLVRAMLAGNMDPATRDLEAKVEGVYGDPMKPQAWIVLVVRPVVNEDGS